MEARLLDLESGAAAGQLPEMVYDYNEHQELADNIWNAIKAGHGPVLTRGKPGVRVNHGKRIWIVRRAETEGCLL